MPHEGRIAGGPWQGAPAYEGLSDNSCDLAKVPAIPGARVGYVSPVEAIEAALDALSPDGRAHDEERGGITEEPAGSQASDPIAALIARLEAGAAQGGPTTLVGRVAVRVRSIAGGFALERRP